MIGCTRCYWWLVPCSPIISNYQCCSTPTATHYISHLLGRPWKTVLQFNWLLVLCLGSSVCIISWPLAIRSSAAQISLQTLVQSLSQVPSRAYDLVRIYVTLCVHSGMLKTLVSPLTLSWPICIHDHLTQKVDNLPLSLLMHPCLHKAVNTISVPALFSHFLLPNSFHPSDLSSLVLLWQGESPWQRLWCTITPFRCGSLTCFTHVLSGLWCCITKSLPKRFILSYLTASSDGLSWQIVFQFFQFSWGCLKSCPGFNHLVIWLWLFIWMHHDLT